jgi:predicted dehydrogenase
MRILIIGLGSIGRRHAKAINSVLPDAKIFALRSKLESDDCLGITNIFDFEEISSKSFDFAIISNPTSKHKETITRMLNFNIPLFIEKPIYNSLDIEEIVRLAVSKKLLTYIACNLRFLDCIRFIKEQMSIENNKRLNEVNVYCGSYLPEWRPGIDFRQTYSANAELGGGVHIDLIHEMDYLYWLFGKPNVVFRSFKNRSSLAISSIDYANYALDYGFFSANIVLNYYRRDTKRSFELVFEDETWNTDLIKNEVSCNGKVIFSSGQIVADTYEKQMRYFIDCVKNRKGTFNTISDAYNVLKICLDGNDIKR